MFKNESLTEIVLLDFGISEIYWKNEITNVMGLTFAYCPPEIKLYDKSKISPKTDLFNFGMYCFFNIVNSRILYELVTENRVWAKC